MAIIKYNIPYARKFPRYVNFTDFAVTYCYSENLIRENLLVCNNWRFVTVHNMLSFHDEPVIRKNIIAKILFASCSAKISVYTVVGIDIKVYDFQIFCTSKHALK